MWLIWVRRGEFIGSWWGNRMERDHWGDLGVDGWIILGRICRRWDVGIWTGLGWPRIDRWRTFVSAVMNLRVPWNAGNFLTSCKPVSCSRRTLHHGVSNAHIELQPETRGVGHVEDQRILQQGYYCVDQTCGSRGGPDVSLFQTR